MHEVQKHPMHTKIQQHIYRIRIHHINITYLLEYAICGLQYIGETKQQLGKSLNGHRSDANCKPDLPLSRHLRSTGHHDSFGMLKATIIDHNPNLDDKSRQERESFWIVKLKTLLPNGINEKK
jgi:tripartite motif-containing protein 2/3